MAFLTVAQVLEMPPLREAGPEVLAGAAGLGREVRWVHSAELADIAPLLRGGDLLLSTGIALPETADELREFATSLGSSEAAGLVIELGRRWQRVPDALIDACEAVTLPLVALHHEVRFAAITQAVGERIVDEQLEELRETHRVHDTFTELSIAEAGPREILEAVQRLAGAAVVLESEQHQVLDYRSGPADIADFLADWTARSRSVQVDGRTGWDERAGWLVTRLGKRDRGWGRLVVQAPTRPSQRLIALTERAAAALAMHRLHDRHRDSVVRRVHHELLLGLLADPTDADVLRRCELAGVPLVKRQLVGLTVRPRGQQLDDLLASVVHAAYDLNVPAIVCEIDRDVRVLLSCAPAANADRVVDNLAERVARRHPVTIGAGRPATKTADVDRTLKEAQQVVESVRADAADRVVHRLEDVHLRGLLTLLGDDDRLRLFVGRELDPLKEHGNGLLDAVRALLHHPAGKSEAAASLHISRPVFYDRLAKAERILGVSLDDPDIRVSLHVALVADELRSFTP
ncbi:MULTISPECIES: PucR family transcriptional regulator [unclassified Kribbella]|uniref:PucR family transcriptional regulator n=1 Tax=unclassified Kribbella TaxID=2644121 RepID=UPI003077DA86